MNVCRQSDCGLWTQPADVTALSFSAMKQSSKVKFTLEQATKAQRWIRGIALLLIEPRCYMGVGGQRHAPAALPPRRTRYPLYRRLGGAQGFLDGCGKSRPSGIRSPDRPARSESLYRLRCRDPPSYESSFIYMYHRREAAVLTARFEVLTAMLLKILT